MTNRRGLQLRAAPQPSTEGWADPITDYAYSRGLQAWRVQVCGLGACPPLLRWPVEGTASSTAIFRDSDSWTSQKMELEAARCRINNVPRQYNHQALYVFQQQVIITSHQHFLANHVFESMHEPLLCLVVVET